MTERHLPVPFFVQWLHIITLWQPERLEPWIVYTLPIEAATDCRAMAKRLRGETSATVNIG